jgi:NAD(P)-dependent dehydrogenase (short-subunit alcohol dehydrogenase family)
MNDEREYDMQLEHRGAVVTGASRGIGRAMALGLADAGADVVVNYVKDRAGAEAVVAEIERLGRRAIAVQGDVSRREDVEGLFETASSAFGDIHVLVNNAGIETIVPFLELTDEQWTRVNDVNLRGTWMCAQVFARTAIKRGHGGAIVNIGSIQAGVALPGRSHYAPTKRAIESLTSNLAAELVAHRIRVNCVHPGVIETDMTQWVTGDADVLPEVLDMIPMARLGQPEEVAPIAVLLASDAASYITGQHIYVDGGMRIV